MDFAVNGDNQQKTGEEEQISGYFLKIKKNEPLGNLF